MISLKNEIEFIAAMTCSQGNNVLMVCNKHTANASCLRYQIMDVFKVTIEEPSITHPSGCGRYTRQGRPYACGRLLYIFYLFQFISSYKRLESILEWNTSMFEPFLSLL